MGSSAASRRTGERGALRGQQRFRSRLVTPHEPQGTMSAAMTDVGYFDDIEGNDPIDDPVGSARRQQRPVPYERVEHRGTQLGKIPEHLELRDNLIVNGDG